MSKKIQTRLDELKTNGGYRTSRVLRAEGVKVSDPENHQQYVNFSGNDYLGLASDMGLQQEFFNQSGVRIEHWMASSSSRALTGTTQSHAMLEQSVANSYQKEQALLFNSGYHANTGILPALTGKQDLILADKLVHASLLDGMRLGSATCKRFAHNDMQHLEQLLLTYRNQFEHIWIVSESIFSMDGDMALLKTLVELKQRYHAYLYIDEAHAVGSYGEAGLGLVVQQGLSQQVDLIVGTFGKALAGYGGFVVGDAVWIDALINFARPWLFSTALPPINIDWNLFIWQQLGEFSRHRETLISSTELFKQLLDEAKQAYLGDTYIIPLLKQGNPQVLALSHHLSEQGCLAMPIRSPTVVKGAERVRFSMTARIEKHQIEHCVQTLSSFEQE